LVTSAKEGAGNPIEAVILFADIIGSVNIADERSLVEYDGILEEFHECAQRAFPVGEYPQTGRLPGCLMYQVRGDEAALVRQVPELEELLGPDDQPKVSRQNVLNDSVHYAVQVKLAWLLSGYNLCRLHNDQLPRDVSVGLHVGRVIHRIRRFHEDEERKTPEGLAISLCKRIQSKAARYGTTRILASSPFVSACASSPPSVTFSQPERVSLRGVHGVIEVAELEPPLSEKYGIDYHTALNLEDHIADETLALLERSAMRNPGEKWLRWLAALSHTFRADLEIDGGASQQAVVHLQTALRIYPQYPYAQHLLDREKKKLAAANSSPVE
jgi:hypothetical protein